MCKILWIDPLVTVPEEKNSPNFSAARNERPADGFTRHGRGLPPLVVGRFGGGGSGQRGQRLSRGPHQDGWSGASLRSFGRIFFGAKSLQCIKISSFGFRWIIKTATPLFWPMTKVCLTTPNKIFLLDSVGETRYQRLTLWLRFCCLPLVF